MLHIVVLVLLRFAMPISEATCGYDNCYTGEIDQFNVHIVPHSHDDVGWVQTVKQYYDNEVESILNTTIQELILNPSYRFIYAEMAFFHKWWSVQNQTLKDDVRHLVNSGRLQFVQGGWSMADEATVYYGDEIDQLTRGRAFLKEEFGQCGVPKVAWQIDTFGHSRDRAELFYDAAYDGLVFQRMDYAEKAERRQNKTMELLWNVGGQKALFTHIMYDSYCYPRDLGLDSKHGAAHFDQDMMGRVAKVFLKLLKSYTNAYRFDHVMVPMGCDFTYTRAHVNYRTMDMMIKKLQGSTVNGKKVNVFYSTPACYFKAINREVHMSEQPLPIRQSDFFPYADREHNYWTGYYTSRPAFKAFVRKSSNLLTVAEQLHVLAAIPKATDVLDELRQQVGIVQHHDAVTGTEKEFVTADYIKQLLKASQPVETLVSKGLSLLMRQNMGWEFCNLRNESICQPTLIEHLPQQFAVVIYNPLSWPLTKHWERIPLGGKMPYNLAVHVQDSDGELVENQLVQTDQGTTELVFSPTAEGRTVPAIGFQAYLVSVHQTEPGHAFQSGQEEKFTNGRFSYHLTAEDNYIVLLAHHKRTGERYKVRIEPGYYMSQSSGREVSGAYIFRPMLNESLKRFSRPILRVEKGGCVTQIKATYDQWITLTVSLYNDGRIEVDWLVGTMPAVYKEHGTEVVVRYTTELVDEIRPCESGEFYTDSDGRRLIKRTRNLNYDDYSDRIAANYYPVLNRILIKGCPLHQAKSELAMAVYTDRAEGGTSLNDGQIELMLFRRLLVDDHLGVEEALLEDGPVRGYHHLVFDEWNWIKPRDRKLATEIVKPPTVLFKGNPKVPTFTKWNALNNPLPSNIHLVSLVSWPLVPPLEPADSKQLLIRLENFAPAADSENAPQEVSLTHLLKNKLIYTANEVTLTADQQKSDAEQERLRWTKSMTDITSGSRIWEENGELKVTIPPESISSFIVEYLPV